MLTRSLFTALSLSALLAGCIPAPDEPTKRPVKSVKQALPANDALKACTSDLAKIGAAFSILPDQYAGNCNAINTVKLTAAGIPVTNLTATQCPLARSFAGWVRTTVQAQARAAFGKPVVRVETMGSYSCRNVIGKSGSRLSQHAFANAIDVSGFILSDGQRITLEGGWRGSEKEQKFLRGVRDSACRSFQTVLSPDYNAAHYNHLHFDMGKGPYCR